MNDVIISFILKLFYEFVLCFVATAAFAWLMRAPGKTPLVSGIIGSTGYLIFHGLSYFIGNDIIGCFSAAAIIAASGEICARKFKMPATVFIFPSVIPLVPGIGLYRTMLALVQSDYVGFAESGAKTLFIAGSIAIPIAFVNILARNLFKAQRVKTEK